jgi:transcription initiation factor TFIID TATA-box-binding protein
MVCTGAKSIICSKKAARIIARIVQKIYQKLNIEARISFLNFEIQNIVGSFNVNYKIDLITFNYAYQTKSFYDPCIFPGLKFRPFSSEKTTILIFISGKIIITGLKDISKLIETKDYMLRILKKYKRPFPYVTFK